MWQRGKGKILKSDVPWFESSFVTLPAVWSQTSYFILRDISSSEHSLCVSLPVTVSLSLSLFLF